MLQMQKPTPTTTTQRDETDRSNRSCSFSDNDEVALNADADALPNIKLDDGRRMLRAFAAQYSPTVPTMMLQKDECQHT